MKAFSLASDGSQKNCVFFCDDEYCEINDFLCKRQCSDYFRKNPDIPPYEKYRILEIRRNSKKEQLIKWLTLIIAVGSLLISLFTLINKTQSQFTLDCNPNQCIVSPCEISTAQTNRTPTYTITSLYQYPIQTNTPNE